MKLRQHNFHIISKTPAPVLSRLEGGDDGMASAREMLRSMTIFGIIAATDMSAGPAQSQMNPVIAHGQAFDAAVARGAHRLDGAEMSALLSFAHDP
jgi:hypothetical protein